MENFIYAKKNAISSELCNEFIENYKKDLTLDTKDRLSSPAEIDGEIKPNIKLSTDIGFNFHHPGWEEHEFGPLLKTFIPILKENLNTYITKYLLQISNNGDGTRTFTYSQNPNETDIAPIFNFQHYKPGEGFYDWHNERSSSEYANRVLVWMVFLNDIKNGGGTEFYHQKHTEKPEQGKMLIFSSEFIHTHRGQIAPSENKYILTGWWGFNKS